VAYIRAMSARDPVGVDDPRPAAATEPGVAADLLARSGVSIARYRLTVGEYHRMAQAGILPDDARVELIQGELVAKAPVASRHYWCTATLIRLLQQAVGDRAILACQAPVRLGDHDEPEPDFALLKPDTPRGKGLPGPADCLLVVEVADSSLAFDLKVKSPLYALHQVSEYWVVDLKKQCLHLFRGPKGHGWTESRIIDPPARIPLPGVAGAHIDLQDLF
jgi:Uma2 family endonuclease